MPGLYGFEFSPWTFKAMWAMVYHDTPYVQKDVTPPITDLVMKWKLGNPNSRITYPILFKDDGSAITESFDISKWSSENLGPNSEGNLFAGFDLDQLQAWDTKAQELLAYGRIYTTDQLLKSKDGVMIAVPGPLKCLGPLAVRFGRWAVGQMRAKYINEPGARDIDKAHAHLTALREAIKGDDPYILGKFSFADITMAVAMQVVKSSSHIPVPAEMLEACSVPAFAEEYSDLLKWRDEMFEKHFKGLKSTS